MSKTVVFNGTRHVFPDNATDDQIRAALSGGSAGASFAGRGLTPPPLPGAAPAEATRVEDPLSRIQRLAAERAEREEHVARVERVSQPGLRGLAETYLPHTMQSLAPPTQVQPPQGPRPPIQYGSPLQRAEAGGAQQPAPPPPAGFQQVTGALATGIPRDILSLPGRGYAMAGEMAGRAIQGEPVTPGEARASLASTRGQTLPGAVLRDWTTIPSIAAGGAVSGPIRQAISQLAQKSPILAQAAILAGENATASGAMAIGHLIDRAVEAQEVTLHDLLGAGLETTVGTGLGVGMGAGLAGATGLGRRVAAPAYEPMAGLSRAARATREAAGPQPSIEMAPDGTVRIFPMKPSQRAFAAGLPEEAQVLSQAEQAAEKIPEFSREAAALGRQQAETVGEVALRAGRGEFAPTEAEGARSQLGARGRRIAEEEEATRGAMGEAYRRSEEQILGEPLVNPADRELRREFLDALPGTPEEQEAVTRLVASYGGDPGIFRRIKAQRSAEMREAPRPGALAQVETAQGVAPEPAAEFGFETAPAPGAPKIPMVHKDVVRPIHDEAGQNLILKDLGIQHGPAFDGFGTYNMASNPNTRYRIPLSASEPEAQAIMKELEKGAAIMRDLFDQESVGFYRLLEEPNPANRSVFSLDFGRGLSASEAEDLIGEIGRLSKVSGGIELIPWERGTNVVNFTDLPNQEVLRIVQEAANKSKWLPDGTLKDFGFDGRLIGKKEGDAVYDQIRRAGDEKGRIALGRVPLLRNQILEAKGIGREGFRIRTQGARRAAWESERGIKSPIDEKLAPDRQARQILQLGAENKRIVDPVLERIPEKFPHTYSRSSFKSPREIMAKPRRPSIQKKKPGFAVPHVRDAFRTMTAFHSIDQIPEIVQFIADETGGKIISIDNKLRTPNMFGWRSVTVEMQMPNGMIMEHMFIPPELDGAVKKLSHGIYKRWRGPDEEMLLKGDPKAFAARSSEMDFSRKILGKAWDQFPASRGMDAAALEASLKNSEAWGSETMRKLSQASSKESGPPLRQTPSSLSMEKSGERTQILPSSGSSPTLNLPAGASATGKPPISKVGEITPERKPDLEEPEVPLAQREPEGRVLKGEYAPQRRAATFYPKADISTAIHELLGHDLEATALPTAVKGAVSKALRDMGIKPLVGPGGKWTTEAREAFARLLEGMAREGLESGKAAPMRPSAVAGAAPTIKAGMRKVYPEEGALPPVPADFRRLVSPYLERSKVLAEVEIPSYADLGTGAIRSRLQDVLDLALKRKFGIDPGRDVGTVGASAIKVARKVSEAIGERQNIGEVRAFIKTDLNPRLNGASGKLEMLGEEFTPDPQTAAVLGEIKRATHDYVRSLWRKNLPSDVASKLEDLDREMLQSYAAGVQGLEAITDVMGKGGKSIEPDKFFTAMNKLPDGEIESRFRALRDAEAKTPEIKGFAEEVRSAYREGFLFSVLDKTAGANFGLVPQPSKIIRFWSDMPASAKRETFTFMERKMMDRTVEILRKAGFADSRMINPSQTAYTLSRMQGGNSVIQAFKDIFTNPVRASSNAFIRTLMRPGKAAKEYYATGSVEGIDRALAFMDGINRWFNRVGGAGKEAARLGAQEKVRESEESLAR